MADKYSSLGFKCPEFMENHCGIKIYIGTKGKEDWCVVVPKNLVEVKLLRRGWDRKDVAKWSKDYVQYLISEDEALSIAEEYTKLSST